MFWISGVLDPRMQHRLVGGMGLLSLFIVAHIGAAINGQPFFFRLFF
jgi:hypothetical protein